MGNNNLKIVKANLKEAEYFELEDNRLANCPNCNYKTQDRACCVKCGKYIDKEGFAPEEEFLWSKAWYADINKDYNKSIMIHSELIKKFPSKSTYYSDRGLAYYHNDQYEEAIEDYTTALKLNPDNEWCCELRADAYLKNKQYDEAFADYTKVIGLSHENPKKYYKRGKAYSSISQYEKAIADFTKGLELTEELLGDMTFDEYYDKLCETEHYDFPFPLYYYLNPRAYAYKELGQFEKALADINKALKNCDWAYDRSGLYDSRAKIYEAAGEYQKAINDCKTALELTSRIAAKIPSTNEILERCRKKLKEKIRHRK